MSKDKEEVLETPEAETLEVPDSESTSLQPDGDETVEVKRSSLEKMLSRLDRLEYAASKAQLAHFDSKIKQDQTKQASVSTFDGKIVIAWSMIENLVEKINGIWVEKQTLKIEYIDGKSEEMPCKKFWLQHQKQSVQVLSERALNTGEVIWEVETIEAGDKEPTKLELDITFVN